MFNSSKTVAKILAMIMVVSMLVLGFAACGGETTADAAITGIEVIAQPTNTQFEVGSTFDYTGAKVKVTFDDGTTQEIAVTSGMIGYYDFSTTGQKDVTVTYTVNGVSKSTTLAVTVVDTIGGIRTDAADAIVNYDKAQAVKNDTVIVALTEAYVSSVNQAADKAEADALVKAYKAAVDAYVGAADAGDDGYAQLIEDLEKQAEELAKALEDAAASSDAAEASALLTSLKLTQGKRLEAAYKAYKAADYKLDKVHDDLDNDNKVDANEFYVPAFDNYAAITEIFEAADAAILDATTAEALTAAVDTAIADMDAVLTVAEHVYATVTEAMAAELYVGFTFVNGPYKYENNYDTIIEVIDDQGTEAMVYYLFCLLIQVEENGDEDLCEYVFEEKMFDNGYGRITRTLEDEAETVLANYENLMSALFSAEATAYQNAVLALVADADCADKDFHGAYVDVEIDVIGPVLDAYRTTANTQAYVSAGSAAEVNAIAAARKAFIDKYFKNDRENVNINTILDTAADFGTNEYDAYYQGFVAIEAAINESWNNALAAASDELLAEIVLGLAHLGSTEVKAPADKAHAAAPSTNPNANAQNVRFTGGYLLYTDLEAIDGVIAKIAEFQAKHNLTNAQVEALVEGSIVAETKAYTFKTSASGNPSVTENLTIYFNATSRVDVAGLGAMAHVSTAKDLNKDGVKGDFLDVIEAAKDEIEARIADFELLSTKAFDGIVIADAVAAFNAKHTPVTIAAIQDRNTLTAAVEKWVAYVEYDATVPADAANQKVMLDAYNKLNAKVNAVIAAAGVAETATNAIWDAYIAVDALYGDNNLLLAGADVDAAAAEVQEAVVALHNFVKLYTGCNKDTCAYGCTANTTASIDAANLELLGWYVDKNDDPINAAELLALAAAGKKYDILVDSYNTAYDSALFLALANAAVVDTVSAYILDTGCYNEANGQVWFALMNGDAYDYSEASIATLKAAVKTAKDNYEDWAETVADASLTRTVVTSKGTKVSIDLVALLAAAEAHLARGEVDIAINAADLADAASIIKALEAYEKWVDTGVSKLDDKGNTHYGEKLAALVDALGVFANNAINTLGNVVYAVDTFTNPLAPVTLAGDSGAALATARKYYDAYVKALAYVPTWTVWSDAQDKFVTTELKNKVEAPATLEAAEARYENSRALAIALNHYISALPANVTTLYTVQSLDTLAYYTNVLKNLAKLFEQYAEVNQILETPVALDASRIDATGKIKLTEADLVQFVIGTATETADYVLTSKGQKLAVGTYVKADTMIVPSLEVVLASLDVKGISYLTFDSIDNAIACYELEAIIRAEFKAVNAECDKALAECISTEQMAVVETVRAEYLAHVDAYRDTYATLSTAGLPAVLEALQGDKGTLAQFAKALKAALN